MSKRKGSGGVCAIITIVFLVVLLSYQTYYCGTTDDEGVVATTVKRPLVSEPPKLQQFPAGHSLHGLNVAKPTTAPTAAPSLKPKPKVASKAPRSSPLPVDSGEGIPGETAVAPPSGNESKEESEKKEEVVENDPPLAPPQAEGEQREGEGGGGLEEAEPVQLEQPQQQRQNKKQLHPSSDHEGEMWKASQDKNFLRRVMGMMHEQHEAHQALRVKTRKTNADRFHNRTKTPVVNCNCQGLSAMDPRDHWCADANGEDGPKVSTSHVCVVHNVCLDGHRMIFVSDREAEGHSREQHVSINLANAVNLHATVVFKPPKGSSEEDSEYYKKLKDPESYRRALDMFDANASSTNGKRAPYPTLAVLGQSAGRHITHFLEPVGSLQVAVRDMMVDDSSINECHEDDLSCFYRPTLTTSNAVQLDEDGLWGQNVLRIVYRDYDRQMSFRKADSVGEDLKCFKKAIIPGAFYGIWPVGADTVAFNDATSEYLSRQRKALNMTQPKKNEKSILLAHRTSKRTITDWDNFVQIVTEHAKKVGAEVNTVMFGSKSFIEQTELAEEASILMGIHGADLTNMVFQKRGSVVVEINPVFFYENRFYEMSVALGHKYIPWNCGTHECAFGGDSYRFENYLQSHNSGGVEYNSTDYTFRTDRDPTPFEWSWKGYTGFACLPCDRICCCSGVKNGFYSELRESNVKIGPPEGRHAREIRSILNDAFIHLGWAKEGEVPTP